VEISTVSRPLILVLRTVVLAAEQAWQEKRRRALLESNPPGNILLETHSVESPEETVSSPVSLL
jgi:hypothetical protein